MLFAFKIIKKRGQVNPDQSASRCIGFLKVSQNKSASSKEKFKIIKIILDKSGGG